MSSASVEFPYWYTRKLEELEGEVPIVRRSESLKSGFEHLTPATSVGVHFISIPKVLEAVLFDGVNLRTGRRVYPAHGKILDTYQELWETFQEYFSLTVEVLTLTNNI